ncbi:MAG: hypothetical protein HFJ59_02215 [Clostridia bacterium]|nr:hypothetical protein [Clostridia bacterium]
MEIIYIITILLLLITTMLIKRNDEKENVLFRGILTIILFTIYNILLTLIFSALRIPSNLIVLSIANIILTTINMLILIKKHEFQKYFIKIQDVIFMFILLILICAIAYNQYGFPFEIKYETSDPALHFSVAKDFYDEKILEGSIPAASVNTAILFDVFDVFVPENDFYYIFIVFDIGILYLIGAIFYLGITNKVEGKIKSIITMIFTILFVCAYPLNSVLFGFSYLTVAILYITTLLAMSINIKDKELKQIPLHVEMFLIVLGIFFSYYLFVPVIYSAFGLYILFDMIKNKKGKNILSIITKENIIKVFTILILPTIIGFGYFVLPGLISSEGTKISHISREGYIYRDLYSNFVLLAPLAIYYVLYNLTKKKNSLSTILTIITSLFTLILLKKGLIGSVSSYYYYKMYFVLWILVLYMNVKAMFIMFENKNEIFVYSFTILMLAIHAISCTEIETKVKKIKVEFNPSYSAPYYTNIYLYNKIKIDTKETIYSKTQLEAMNFILDKTCNKSEILLNGSQLQRLWANLAWEIIDTENIKEILSSNRKFNINNWLEDKEKKYLIYFYKEEANDIKEEPNKYQIIYKTNDAIVLEKITNAT